jgi:hypothetical protein
MSTFRGWPEQQTYAGIEGAMQFNADWAEAWDDLEFEVEDYIDAGEERVVTIVHQRGRSKATGVPVEMRLGMFGQSRTDRESGCRCTRARRKPSKPPGCGADEGRSPAEVSLAGAAFERFRSACVRG